MKTQVYKVSGMTCSGCANAVERATKKLPGVVSAQVNLMENTLCVETDVSFEEIKAAVEEAGFGLEKEQDEEVEEERSWLRKYQLIITFLLSLPVFVIGMFFHHWRVGAYISFLLTIPVMFWLGNHFYIKAFQLLKAKSANMDTLVALSTGVAFVYSTFNLFFPQVLLSQGIEPHLYFESIVVIIAFIKLGKWLEENAKRGSSEALKILSKLIPQKVIKIENDSEVLSPTYSIKVGDIVRVKPGDVIPVDGIVVAGRSSVNESAITGESIGEEKIECSKVFAGGVNQTGVLDIRVEAVSKDTLVGRVVENVKKSLQGKSPSQRVADKLAAIFVPIVIVVAILTFTFWLLVGGKETFAQAITATISVLVIACPCALGLATPAALVTGMGKAAQWGIWYKNSEAIENAASISHLILDKTGTLTNGKPQIVSFKDFHPNVDWKSVIYSMEMLSRHPLSEPLQVLWKNQPNVNITNFEDVAGNGLSAVFNDKVYFAGARRFLESKNIDFQKFDKNVKLEELDGYTLIFFANSQEGLLGFAALFDELKPESYQLIQKLKKQKIKPVILSGDNEASVKKVATKLGITTWKSACLPSDKSAYIKDLKQQGHKVAMLGDGINDVEALAVADTGLAIGEGTESAREVASVNLVRQDISLVAYALKIARKTNQTLKTNLFWAFFYNIVMIPLAAGLLYPFTGWMMSPMIAGVAMAFSSVSVLANSLLLRRINP